MVYRKRRYRMALGVSGYVPCHRWVVEAANKEGALRAAKKQVSVWIEEAGV